MKRKTKKLIKKWFYYAGGFVGIVFAVQSITPKPESTNSLILDIPLFSFGIIFAWLMFAWADEI